MAAPTEPLVLASTSPRRADLLEEAGIDFEIVPSDAEEIHDPALAPHLLVETNARLKAAAVSEAHPGRLVLGADTLVFLEGNPLGKPADLEEAFEMVQRLAGRAHEVITGVAILRGTPAHEEVFHSVTKVRFKALTDEAIRAYHQLIEPLDKAGAYAAQEHGEKIIKGFDGPYSNVVGLPVEEVGRRLETVC